MVLIRTWFHFFDSKIYTEKNRSLNSCQKLVRLTSFALSKWRWQNRRVLTRQWQVISQNLSLSCQKLVKPCMTKMTFATNQAVLICHCLVKPRHHKHLAKDSHRSHKHKRIWETTDPKVKCLTCNAKHQGSHLTSLRGIGVYKGSSNCYSLG